MPPTQRVLKGDEKAAALLLALGPDYGKPIFDELDELEVKQLSRAMVRLGPITQEMLDDLMIEFVTTISSNGSLSGNTDSTERLLLSFLPPGQGRCHHGRNPWSGRPQHVGKALQRAGRRARRLSQERISPDHRRGAVQDRHRPRLQGPGRPARGTGHGRGAAHARASIRCRRKSSKRSRPPCAPNSCRRSTTPSAATATSRWPKSSTASIARPKRASSPRSKSTAATTPSASSR